MRVSRQESIRVLLDTLHAHYVGRVDYDEETNVAHLDDGTRVFVTWDNVIGWIKSVPHHKSVAP